MTAAVVVLGLSLALEAQMIPTQGELDLALRNEDRRQVIVAEATAYAPLDPNAVEGMCYSGNPNTTATGTQTREGIIAADPARLPYGTEVYILELQRSFVVEDTGGAMRRAPHILIDIFVERRSDAFAWGRRQVTLIVLN